ncbi:pseudouridine synthase [Amphritea sp. 1_MG-2023]|uniref:pseudouridine synthase n=1 Tax=Amphritea sp. 1_MG-2023 TaxID=3062670 RepID=UPI0026E34CBD|nr:pseudouridine synthase [Amphritea sp. 1_MG-2023]MDO6564168.1 pseudouridine synthase [Amphritea sp. 1_MG-2023]
MRLDKFICKSSDYALADVVALIKAQRVKVNGQLASCATQQVHINNSVTLDGGVLTPRPFRYYLLNKPAEMICSNIDEHYPSALNLLGVERIEELHIAGRLDADTTGLVLVTDDGHWSYRLTSPNYRCEKVYEVVLSRPIKPEAVQRFQAGIRLQGETQLTRPAALVIIDPYHVRLTLTEGRFHQVKRMFAAMGNRVKALHRQQIGCLCLDVDLGDWRCLTAAEVNALSGNDERYQALDIEAVNPLKRPYS